MEAGSGRCESSFSDRKLVESNMHERVIHLCVRPYSVYLVCQKQAKKKGPDFLRFFEKMFSVK